MGPVLIVVPSSLIFNWQDEIQKFTPELKLHIFSAQDIEKICTDLGYNFDGLHIPDANNPTDNYSVAYSQFIMPLVKAMQEQQQMIQTQQQQIELLKLEIELLKNK